MKPLQNCDYNAGIWVLKICLNNSLIGTWGNVVVMARATSRKVSGSIPSAVAGDFFFRGYRRNNHVPWGRFSV
jgi:hypothetical protein